MTVKILPKKKRTTKLERAEKASANKIRELINAQESARKKYEEFERERIAKEEKQDEQEAQNNLQLLGAMS